MLLMNKEIKLNNYFKKINNTLFVCYQPNFEDFRAVISSKVSREIILQKKSFMNAENIKQFLLQNLAKYNHASIGEMCILTIYHFGFGWVSSFLLCDQPLFIGQEVSTRAVDILKSVNNICYDSNNVKGALESFVFFKNIFLNLKQSSLTQKKGYKFDYIRWCLPGNISTGLIYNVNGRVLSRHLNILKNFNFMKRVVEQYELGFKTIAPNIFISLNKSRKNINIPSNIKIQNIEQRDRFKICDIEWINKPKKLHLIIDMLINKYSKNLKLEYLPLELKKLGLFNVNIYCSIAAARDWHRHRPVMPWTISLILDQDNLPIIYHMYDKYILDKHKILINKFFKQKQFFKNKNKINWPDLYVLPFGTMVVMNCTTTLDYLFYMLKLRSNSKNANFEYKKQAEVGLLLLKRMLPQRLMDHFNLK